MNWIEGFEEVMKSLTTEILFLSNLPQVQNTFLKSLLTLRSKLNPKFLKIFEDYLVKKPYSFLTVISTVQSELSINDQKLIIEKTLPLVTVHQYGNVKRTDLYQEF